MPGQGRLGDKASVAQDAHGCPACPHPAIGPAIQGSPNVNVNRRPALRVDDPGIHAACCGKNTWKATKGSSTVFINGKGAHRMGDQNSHCGGLGQLIEGSPNVIVGEAASAFAAAAPTVRSAAPGGARGSASAGADQPTPPAATDTSLAPRATPPEPGEIAARSTEPPATEPPATEPPATEPPATAPPATEPPPTAPPATEPPATDTTRPAPTWLEIVLVGEDGKGLSGERYTVVLPDGARRTGFLDEDGRTSFEDLIPGSCQVSFPDLDSEAWQSVDD